MAAGYKVVSGLLIYNTIICVLQSIAYIFYIHLLLIIHYMHSIVNYLVFVLGSFMIGLCECMCMYMLGIRTGTKRLGMLPSIHVSNLYKYFRRTSAYVINGRSIVIFLWL